eukprot:TRINITY_DN13098_c0_g1_i1.p1 TRINITY_DN13098_c0_g1~~TRINITY_DN13098_c0_g1_i1.p1  ORF type:complete len:211 (-),score=16.04 TRINITY_DN13098_c0_g1_i1:231-863(-)
MDQNVPPPDYDCLYKIVILGSYQANKDHLMSRLGDDSFDPLAPRQHTIGVDFCIRRLQLGNGKRVKIQLWSTSGGERFRAVTRSYYRGAVGVILMYDLNNKDTWEEVQHWYDEAKQYAAEDVTYIVVGHPAPPMYGGTNHDKKRQVSFATVKQWAEANGVPAFEVGRSAKIGERILTPLCEEIFDQVGERMPTPFKPTPANEPTGSWCAC